MKELFSCLFVFLLFVLSGCSTPQNQDSQSSTYPMVQQTTVEQATMQGTTDSQEAKPYYTFYDKDTLYTFDDISFLIPKGWNGYLSNDSTSYCLDNCGVSIYITKHTEDSDEVIRGYSESYEGYREVADTKYQNVIYSEHLGMDNTTLNGNRAYFDSVMICTELLNQTCYVYVVPYKESTYSIEYFELQTRMYGQEESNTPKNVIDDYTILTDSISFK